ncbi:UDP-glycosyltransferase 74F2 [Acorus calamus]|uniref:Glycosyltransferase n=1 Tax=Acorus calamus TaxID=4465 RepID=A0AAV9CFK8_ACOCL|nr:UDP-glycosyltransferase 74F2 [Acorus calamus]
MEMERKRTRVLLLPYPSQGHINPMIQFAKRLITHNIKPTLVVTRFVFASAWPDPSCPVDIATISDGHDDSEFAGDLDAFRVHGSRTLLELIESGRRADEPFTCVVYDPFMPWALDVAKQAGLIGAAFFTQTCTVCAVYYQMYHGKIRAPLVVDQTVEIEGVSRPFKVEELPSFLSVAGSYPAYFAMVLNQFSNIEGADWVFFNSVYELEKEAVDWMATLLPVKTIGPTIPSMYLDNHHDKDDSSYGFSLFKPDLDSCVEWLNTKAAQSVVYVSFGSLAELGSEQIEELAHGLLGCGKPFIWVVRASEESNLPINFRAMTKEKGLSLIVRWCSQLEVLAHKSVGCFVSHCGWNSLLEAMSMGMPVVGVPLWTDQPTNAALVSKVWGTGVRVGVDGGGVARREELERCIRRVMEEEEFGRRIGEWRDVVRAAATTVGGGGSSCRNIEEFVSKICVDG